MNVPCISLVLFDYWALVLYAVTYAATALSPLQPITFSLLSAISFVDNDTKNTTLEPGWDYEISLPNAENFPGLPGLSTQLHLARLSID